jgi:hypothetical protein
MAEAYHTRASPNFLWNPDGEWEVTPGNWLRSWAELSEERINERGGIELQ